MKPLAEADSILLKHVQHFILTAGSLSIPEGVDPDLLAKALMNPEMQALLVSFAKKMEGG